MPAAALLSVETASDGVALVTLRRPEKRNALSIELRSELTEAFGRLARDDGAGCIVLTGAGSAFCSGMDVTQFGGDRAHKELLVETSLAAFEAVRLCPKPVIAAVNGPALAGGFALALLCDVRIAAHGARFGFSELPRGIPPAFAAVRSVASAALAAELTLTGRVLDAAEALGAGLVSEVVEDAVARALEIAAAIAAMPRAATAETKRRVLLDREQAWGALFEDEAQTFRSALLDP